MRLIIFIFYILCIISINSNQINIEHIKIHSFESVESNKKITRNGILIRKENAKANVIICHGYTANKYDISFINMLFPECNTLTFDFRAHGENTENQCCTFGRNESFDVLAAAEFVKIHKDLKDLPIICYGFSMGAVSAIIAQATHRNLFDAMILDCPFDSTDKLIERLLVKFKINLFGYKMALPQFVKKYAYNTKTQKCILSLLKKFSNVDSGIETFMPRIYPFEAIKYISCPCFLIDCVNDDKVPEEAILSIYDNIKGFKRLWLTAGRGHFDTIFYKTHDYCRKVNNFILNIINNKTDSKSQSKIIKDLSINSSKSIRNKFINAI